MSLQFFNPWIGRMNRQQFLAGAFICGGAMYLGTEYIPEPALSFSVYFFFGYMFLVFFARRVADQRNDDHDHIPERYRQANAAVGSLPSAIDFLQFFAGLTKFYQYLAQNPVLGGILMIFGVYPIVYVVHTVSVPIAVAALAVLVLSLLGEGHPRKNKAGCPPISMDFSTTIPATYPVALAQQFEAIEQEQFEARERELQEQLERVKATRKAKTSDSSHYVDFRGRA